MTESNQIDKINDKMIEPEVKSEPLTLTKDKEILVIGKEILFGKEYFTGFMKKDSINYEERILSNIDYTKRSLAEKDHGFKQPIVYTIIVNPKTKKVFAYQRASDKNYNEKRLKGKWAIGVGGHIEKIDGSENPIKESMLRELNEEVNIKGKINPFILGYINDDINDVDKVHFGILYVVETNSDVSPKDSEIAQGEFMDIYELEKICSSDLAEKWAKISFAPIKRYLENL